MITVTVPVEDMQDYDEMEKELLDIFKKEIFIPLFSVDKESFKNSKGSHLEGRIESGIIKFNQGEFSGRFDAKSSKELKALGAKWNRKTKTFKIRLEALPKSTKAAISVSEARFISKIETLKRKIKKMNPANIAGRFDGFKFFDKLVKKNDASISRSLASIVVSPVLTEEARARLVKEYTENFNKNIVGWADSEVKKLRETVEEHANKGLRAESLIKKIKTRYNVTQSKAKFIARQETRLVMAKFRETRYRDAGSKGYIWKTVVGSPKHPVRPMHKALDGKFFKWDNPPISNPQGHRNHPGEDFNCRCRPKVVVRF